MTAQRLALPDLLHGCMCAHTCAPGLQPRQFSGSGLFQVFVPPEGGPYVPPALREPAGKHQQFGAQLLLPASGQLAQARFV